MVSNDINHESNSLNNYAVSSDGIATALKDSASALMEAGNSLEQSTALVAAANKVVQDPSSVGSALRTISLRLRGTSVEILEEMGEETEGVVESTSKLQEKLKALTGVDILTDAGSYKDTYTILKEIGEVWQDLDPMDQAAALELMAGKNRANTLAAILNNMEDLEGAYNDALKAEGSALKENAAYLDSIQGRIDLFNNAIQTMWMNLINSDMVKGVVDIGTGLVQAFDTVIGKITAVGLAIAGLRLGHNLKKEGTDLVSLIFDVAPEKIKNSSAIQKIVAPIKEALAEAMADPSTGVNPADVLAEFANFDDGNGALGELSSLFGEDLLTRDKLKELLDGFDDISDATKEAVLNGNLFAAFQVDAAAGTSIFSKVLANAKKSLANFAKGFKAFVTTYPYVTALIGAVGVLIAAWKIYDNNFSHRHYVEVLEEETQSLKNIQTELAAVNEELKNTNQRIDELNSKETLSFVEEEELNRLKEQTAELERQEQILQAQEKRARNKQVETALKAIQTDPELQKIDFASIFSSISSNAITGDMSIGIQNFDTESAYVNAYEDTLNDLETAKEELEKAQEKLSTTTYRAESREYKKLEKQVEKAQNRVDDYNSQLDSLNETWQTKYGEIGYIENASTEAEKQWNELYRQHQDYIDKQALINGDYGISTILDRAFGTTGTDVAKKFKKEFEASVKSGKDPSDVIEELFANKDYSSAFDGLETQFGITLDNIKGYFTQTGEFATENPKFDITKYTKTISNHSAVISEYQEALQSLGKGSFTMDDFMALIEKYPELAEGVDISSNAFYGLSRNLNRAIKSNTKSFINDLKNLKKSLIAAGESTESIDQLIEAVEKMPTDALDDTIEKYGTLAKTINEARLAQDKLLASMEENPNEGYETRGQALEYIKDKASRGELGSESEVWDVAKEYGYIYDHTKSLEENKDAMMKWAAVREKWFKKDDDGNYTFEGTENFIQDVDALVDKMPELQSLLTWDYDENTGILNFDFANENLPEIISILSKTQEFAHLTAEEWTDMMMQIGQYYDLDWSNYNDVLDELGNIAKGASDAKTKVEEYGKTMQEYFGKGDVDLTNRSEISAEEMQKAGWTDFNDDYATVYTSTYNKSEFKELEAGEADTAIVLTPILPDGTVLSPEKLKEYAGKLLSGEEIDVEGITLGVFDNPKELSGFEEALHEAQAEYHELMDSYNIVATIDEKGLQGLREIDGLQEAINERADGTVVINEDVFETVLTEAGYTENKIDALTEKIKNLDDKAFNIDPLNIDEALLSKDISQLNEIEELQSAIQEDSKTGLTVLDTDAFRTVLDDAGYAKEHIDELIATIQTYHGVVSTSSGTDPLGLNSSITDINTLKASLGTLGIGFNETIGAWFDGQKEIKINIPDLVSTLQEKGWNEQSIRDYCVKLAETEIEGFKILVNQTQLDEALAKSNEIPEKENTTYTIDGNGLSDLKTINEELDKIPTKKSTEITITETTVKKTEVEDDSGFNIFNPVTWFDGVVNGTAHAQGTWGASSTETALTGELGPELLVRGNKWTTVGENGAEFTQVKKGDIIFNHKQTESLLKNGYVTGRGKAYAGGTAFASGSGIFSRYDFSGNGGYTKYDVNGNVLDEFGNTISDAASDAADEFREVFDWIAIRLEEINEQISYRSAKLENQIGYKAQNKVIDEMIELNQKLYDNLTIGADSYYSYAKTLLSKIPESYHDAVKNGAISIEEFTGEVEEKTLEAIQEYREWVQKGDDAAQQAEETLTEIRNLAKQAIDNIAQDYENKNSLENEIKIEQLEAYNSLLEAQYGSESSTIYDQLSKEVNEKIALLEKQRNDMQAELNSKIVSNEITVGSQEWYDAVNDISAVDVEIINLMQDTEDYQDAVNELEWDNFDKLVDKLGSISDEASDLIDILSNKDLVDDDGNWTNEGMTALGLYAQQMEIAEKQVEEYSDAINKLEQDYKQGKYSEQEYQEKLEELKDGQRDAIKSYHDAKDAIVDLNKERVDSIKNGIEKEIDAYKELIDVKKEELDAEKDLYDFQRSIQNSSKNIADLERQLAALSGDNSASARAKRAQLEAELAEARQELEDQYYDRSIQNQQEALDKELENFQETKNKEMEGWDEYLENTEQVVSDSLITIQANTEVVYQTLKTMGEEYSLSISEVLTSPWEDGASAIQSYTETFGSAISSTMEELDKLASKYDELNKNIEASGSQQVEKVESNVQKYTEAENATPQTQVTTTPKEEPKKEDETKPSLTQGSYVQVKSGTKWYADSYGGGASGTAKSGTIKYINESGSHPYNIDGLGWVRKKDIQGYAKGTTGVKKDQLAWIDEMGLEELVLHAGPDGRLQYLTKGTSVIPHDISENLMKLGRLDPSAILDQNKPQIGVSPNVVNNTIEVNMDIAEVVHIDTVTSDTIPDLTKAVRKEMDSYMVKLNNAIKAKVR